MNRWTNGLLALALIAGLTACQQQAAEQEGATEETVEETGDVEATIDELGNEFEAAVESNDPAALAALYTEDAVLLPPGAERVEGKQGIQSTFAEWLDADPTASIELTADKVEVAESGELAYEIGTAQVSGTGPDGAAYDETGKYLVVWKRVDGEWKTAADSWSLDTPPPGMEEAGETKPTGETEPESEGMETEPEPAETGETS